MKLVPKLTIALVLASSVLLAVNGYLRIRREVAYFEADRVRDHGMIGRSLAAATTAIWKSDGPDAAVHAVESADANFTRVRIRWLPGLHPSDGSVAASELDPIPAGKALTRVSEDATPRWSTYVPVDVDGVRRGAIALTEPAIAEQHFRESTIVDTLGMAAALAVLSAALSFALGQWLVGAPIRALADKARRIGRGDFGGPLVLKRHDELTELGAEMNSMCDRLSATLDQLRHADRLATVGKLASGVAHELGTPLNVVSARAQMIARGEAAGDETREYARVIAGAADRMAKIIRQLLQFARRKGPAKEPRDVRELAEESLELLAPIAHKRNVELEVAPAPGVTTANVDAAQLQQVLTNLAMNAVQAMPGGGKVTVTLSSEHAQPPPDVGAAPGDFLCVRVKDLGEGIAPADLPHVFEPFFTTKDVGEGTGLGLAVSYGIVRDHGGWISVESAVGRGSVFTVFLPQPASGAR